VSDGLLLINRNTSVRRVKMGPDQSYAFWGLIITSATLCSSF